MVSLGFFPSLEAFKRKRHEIRAGGERIRGKGQRIRTVGKVSGNTGKKEQESRHGKEKEQETRLGKRTGDKKGEKSAGASVLDP